MNSAEQQILELYQYHQWHKIHQTKINLALKFYNYAPINFMKLKTQGHT